MKNANNTGSTPNTNPTIQECLRCKHKWMSRVKYPKRCPNCTSPYWSKQKVMIHYVKNEGVNLGDLPAANLTLSLPPIANLPPRLYPILKSHLMIAMRDKYPKIEFELKGNEIIEIL